MKNTLFIRTLKETLQKLKQENEGLLVKLKQVDILRENDPERSMIHDIWHTYHIQTEFKEFIEGLLQKQYEQVSQV